MIRDLTWSRAATAYSSGYGFVIAANTVPAPKVANATVIDWHDGDTGTFNVDRLDDDYSIWQVRLLGLNAIELSKPGGKEARDNLRTLLPAGTPVVLQSIGNDKYAPRKDCAVSFLHEGTVTDLAAYLISQQWAAAWDGKGAAPVPPWPRTFGETVEDPCTCGHALHRHDMGHGCIECRCRGWVDATQ